MEEVYFLQGVPIRLAVLTVFGQLYSIWSVMVFGQLWYLHISLAFPGRRTAGILGKIRKLMELVPSTGVFLSFWAFPCPGLFGYQWLPTIVSVYKRSRATSFPHGERGQNESISEGL